MKINSISPAFTGQNIRITKELNKNKKFLCNDVLDIIQKNHVPTIFTNEDIIISSPATPNMSKVMDSLKEAGINFETIG